MEAVQPVAQEGIHERIAEQMLVLFVPKKHGDNRGRDRACLSGAGRQSCRGADCALPCAQVDEDLVEMGQSTFEVHPLQKKKTPSSKTKTPTSQKKKKHRLQQEHPLQNKRTLQKKKNTHSNGAGQDHFPGAP